jgi:hypothetical protein
VAIKARKELIVVSVFVGGCVSVVCCGGGSLERASWLMIVRLGGPEQRREGGDGGGGGEWPPRHTLASKWCQSPWGVV